MKSQRVRALSSSGSDEDGDEDSRVRQRQRQRQRQQDSLRGLRMSMDRAKTEALSRRRAPDTQSDSSTSGGELARLAPKKEKEARVAAVGHQRAQSKVASRPTTTKIVVRSSSSDSGEPAVQEPAPRQREATPDQPVHVKLSQLVALFERGGSIDPDVIHTMTCGGVSHTMTPGRSSRDTRADAVRRKYALQFEVAQETFRKSLCRLLRDLQTELAGRDPVSRDAGAQGLRRKPLAVSDDDDDHHRTLPSSRAAGKQLESSTRKQHGDADQALRDALERTKIQSNAMRASYASQLARVERVEQRGRPPPGEQRQLQRPVVSIPLSAAHFASVAAATASAAARPPPHGSGLQRRVPDLFDSSTSSGDSGRGAASRRASSAQKAATPSRSAQQWLGRKFMRGGSSDSDS
jgi:hypothetical protein